MNKRVMFPFILVIALSLFTTACSAVLASTNKPIVAITSPASNSQFRAGDQVTVQSSSTAPGGIVRVELAVDGNVVRADPSPTPQVSFTVNQQWTATPGTHLITVRAIDTANVTSDPAAVDVMVLPATSTPIPTPTLTPASRSCANNSTFVADVTVPDQTPVAPGQAFNKIWRVRNTGTCAWGTGDVLVFVSGEPMTPATSVAAPSTLPGSTADLLVVLAAPTTPGIHTGSWRLKTASGTFFGAALNVTINVVGPAVSNCPFTPVIESFTASSTTITLGQAATLSWGRVLGAESAEIDNDIGGVATPGSTTVSPATTTTYTLTAVCASKVKTAQVTITVVSPSATPTATPTNAPTATRTPTP